MGIIKERGLAISTLKKLTEDPNKVLFIHYSQSNTFDDDDYGSISPIITSIVIKSLDGQIDQQFAIHFEADKADIPIDEIQNSYRDLELRILKAFNSFVKRHSDCNWIHWDMKNIHFGFEGIKHRYEKIFGNLNDFNEIPVNNKKNLFDIIEKIYGEKFVDGSDTLKSLMKCNSNNIDNNAYLSSAVESTEFGRKNFVNVIKSVDLKVDFIKKATNKLIQRKLIVSNKNRYAIFADTVNHPIFTFIGWIIGIIGFFLTIWSLK
ncbi:hypothetical protein [Arcicella lustrica]|uniref:Uncharacterized protein n=1 Tax=Arcicella lustrica TaxID=2984196 RepID=A0ABU5SDZ4_9BACT|nr:hypothetical protein [Arcicella sp. DC25W]MEA5425402.1 hypothetical protein [Arcicella sp. DC25W]